MPPLASEGTVRIRVCFHLPLPRADFVRIAAVGFLALCLFTSPQARSQAAKDQPHKRDLTQISIEDLMNTEVTSVSKKEQKLSRTAAAIFVITQEDIRRSGSTNIPDLLRMVPGLDVAQIDASTWAISSRGFNNQFANKLLVLIDGRTVYSPLFSGVFWDAQGVPLEDIDRIEVIRGPGATAWGANAVNGVVNIITKKAETTDGGLVSSGGGTYEQGFGFARYGGKIGSSTAYRVFSNYFSRTNLQDLAGRGANDGWSVFHAGYRMDANPTAKDSVSFEGDTSIGSEGERAQTITSISPPVNQILNLQQEFSGWDVLGRWDHVASARSATSLAVSLSRTNRSDPTYGEGRNTFDLDFQHHLAWGGHQDIVWGLGYRATSDNIPPTLRLSLSPSKETDQLFSSFIQDEIALSPDRLYLTLGTKLEHNNFTGFEFQPSVRVAWLANQHNMLWVGLSRAVHTPSRTDESVRFNAAASPGPGGLPAIVSDFGNPHKKSEEVLATEFGYRVEPAPNLSLDMTAFFNRYSRLATTETEVPFLESAPAPLHWVIPFQLANLMDGETHGLELAANWKLNSRWTVSPAYSFLALHMHPSASSTNLLAGASVEGSSPHQQAQLRSHVQLTPRLDWDASAYFVGPLTSQGVPSYTRLDTSLIWYLAENLSLSVVGQNLLKDHHVEFSSPDQVVLSSQVKRSAYAKLTWRF
jgi:iron complex outermembrane recepter protein